MNGWLPYLPGGVGRLAAAAVQGGGFAPKPVRCGCADAGHERGCAVRVVLDRRRRLYAGLYDDRPERRPVRGSSPVQLLNPGLVDEDATSRRFSLLEID